MIAATITCSTSQPQPTLSRQNGNGKTTTPPEPSWSPRVWSFQRRAQPFQTGQAVRRVLETRNETRYRTSTSVTFRGTMT